jgi:hypothetical protein
MPVLSDRQLAGYIKASPWPANEHVTLFAVIVGESSKRTDVVNSTGHKGLLQISPVHGFKGNSLDPAINLKQGYDVWKRQGWGAWVVHSNGSFRAHLGRARRALGNPADVPTSAPGSAVSSAGSSGGTEGISGFFTLVGDPHTYLRVGAFLLGGFLLVIGLARVMGVGVGDVVAMAVMKKPIKVKR